MRDKKDPFSHPFFTDTDNYMRKQRIKYIIISLLLVGGMYFMLNKIVDKSETQVEITKSFIGKQVKIENNVMTIINYSHLKGTYTLSNGIEYDMDFVKSKIIE